MNTYDPILTLLITGIPMFDDTSASNYTRKQKLQMEIPSGIIRGIQQELLRLGYFEIGVIDGIYGPRTHAAIMRYQKERNREIEKMLEKYHD